MMKFKLLLMVFCFVLCSSALKAEEKWLRKQTSNFVVLTLNDKDLKLISDNIEQINDWLISRWCLPKFDYPPRQREPHLQIESGVMVLAVNNRDQMQELFNLNGSMQETNYDSIGKIKANYVWILFDRNLQADFPAMLLLAYFNELQARGINVPFGYRRGMSVLSGNYSQIKLSLVRASNNFTTNDVEGMNYEYWAKMDKEKRIAFDAECACLILMLRKEVGREQSKNFLISNERGDIAVRKHLGYRSHDEMTKTFHLYVSNLVDDLKTGKTPNSYLQID